jgi:hypothetical protein
MFQMEGAQSFKPPQINNIKGPNKSTNNNIWTFLTSFITQGIEFNQKTRFGQEVNNIILWGEHPFQCWETPEGS